MYAIHSQIDTSDLRYTVALMSSQVPNDMQIFFHCVAKVARRTLNNIEEESLLSLVGWLVG